MPYMIMVSHSGKASERQWQPTGLVFEGGQEAGDYAKKENEFVRNNVFWNASGGSNTLYRAVKVSEDDPLLWRERENKKLQDGTYKPVPWLEYYGQSSHMYEHIDPNEPTQIRFISCPEDGMAGRYTSMNPGRFIRKYLDSYPNPRLMDKWCASMGLDATTSPLMIATTAEDIIRVYNEGPHSCMAYRIETEDGVINPFTAVDQHPVCVYGDSDIAVAYITRRGEITARCTIWPEKKIHGRIYGDTERIKERLTQEGYEENWDGFAGARIRQVRTKTNNRLILPYIDGELGVILDGDDYLLLSEKPHIIAKSPNGVALALSCHYCGASGVHLEETRDDDEDELYYICAEGCQH